ncbi:MAG: EAL domain-containing protein [Gammaproteobacteria bacterium]
MQTRHLNIAVALSEDSFLVLEQLAELFSLIDGKGEKNTQMRQQLVEKVNKNWDQWQFIWDLENITFFDRQGLPLESWGRELKTADSSVNQVLRQESPVHEVVCPDVCYQQVVIPVMGQSASLGAFSVSRSFADVVIKYKRATGSDIGILVENSSSVEQHWPYRLSAKTFAGVDFDLLGYITRHYSIEQLLADNEILKLNDQIYEIRIGQVQRLDTLKPPFFIFVKDVTTEINALNHHLKSVWLQGVLSFLFSLAFLLTALWFFLRRLLNLSKALPLLASHEYDAFRQQVCNKKVQLLGYDEFDHLNQTVLDLTRQLEHLEHVVRENTLQILEKSQDLASERDFIQQLINVAPIIIITQKLNGLILSINQAGLNALEEERGAVVGKLFDLYLPASEKRHLEKLNRLRAGAYPQRVQIDGGLINRAGQYRDIFWVHSVIHTSIESNEAIVLTLGVDISVDKIAEQKMLKMATFDPLTGLGNQRRFQSELAHALTLAKRYGHSVALFSFDIGANSGVAYQVDKNILVQTASYLKQMMRTSDLLCRMEDDQFTLIMPNAQKEGIVFLARKIISKINALSISGEGRAVPVNVSIGIAVYPQHGATIDKLFANAELAMRYAKASGPNLYHIFDPGRDNNQTRWYQRIHWQALIENALEADKFELCYRVVFDVEANRIDYYQTFARIKEDDGQIYMPSEYAQYAEQLGISSRIDRAIINKAVHLLAGFNAQNVKIHMSINLSRASLTDSNLSNELAALLRDAGVDPRQIIFEISEASALSNFMETQHFIKKVKELGCLFMLNEFGLEFSSFFYLKHLPVDYVKIDGAFIEQLDKSKEDEMYIRALIEVAQAFGKETVAECVYSEDVLVKIKTIGIDYAEGTQVKVFEHALEKQATFESKWL